ncbi:MULTISPECIES: hypothetical protein [unclassified Uliginosibacterium]|uniref:hypothetical protein n=1 Tax=unclassified Uliginosibacterium TaxID=2621521 RepID=UPI0013040B53|nr:MULTISPECIES: hypothetical protein [unclassified Uliginosibacterium]
MRNRFIVPDPLFTHFRILRKYCAFVVLVGADVFAQLDLRLFAPNPVLLWQPRLFALFPIGKKCHLIPWV